MPTNDGGAAFPTVVHDKEFGPWTAWGMSLRDHFAAKALPAIAHLISANEALHRQVYGVPIDGRSDAEKIAALARLSYQVADAMLAEREKVQP